MAPRALPSPNLFKESESEQIFTIVISNQFKTGFRMRLTSSVKEIGAILQKLIKTWINPGRKMRQNEMASLAMRMNLGLATSVVGSGQRRKQNLFSQELEK